MANTKRAKALNRKAEMEAQKRRDDATVNICGAQKHDGSICSQRAGWGTTHVGWGRCRHHGGMLRGGAIAAAREEMHGMARPANVSAQQALRAVLRLAAGQLAYASAQVSNLSDDDLFVRAYSPSDGAITMVPHHWLKLQRDVMNDVARYSKMAMDAGVAERGILVKEQQTTMVADLLERVVDSLELTDEQREQLGPTIRRHLTLVEDDAQDDG